MAEATKELTKALGCPSCESDPVRGWPMALLLALQSCWVTGRIAPSGAAFSVSERSRGGLWRSYIVYREPVVAALRAA